METREADESLPKIPTVIMTGVHIVMEITLCGYLSLGTHLFYQISSDSIKWLQCIKLSVNSPVFFPHWRIICTPCLQIRQLVRKSWRHNWSEDFWTILLAMRTTIMKTYFYNTDKSIGNNADTRSTSVDNDCNNYKNNVNGVNYDDHRSLMMNELQGWWVNPLNAFSNLQDRRFRQNVKGKQSTYVNWQLFSPLLPLISYFKMLCCCWILEVRMLQCEDNFNDAQYCCTYIYSSYS